MFHTMGAVTPPECRVSRWSVIESTIAKGDTLRLDDARDSEIRVISGCLWITQQHDTADYVLDLLEQELDGAVARDGQRGGVSSH